jgi:myo-inositol-1(or 4)-monophosphatase
MDQRHLEVAVAAARAGAAELMLRRESRVVSEKAPKDLVTDADLASQKAVRAVLESSFPGYAFVGEEEGENDPPNSVLAGEDSAPPCWVVDPLDGTVNFVHGLQNFAVSIGLYAKGKMRLGVILDPVYEELFTAVDGGGAFCNGRKMKTGTCDRISHALIACSFPAGISRESAEIHRFVDVLEHCQSLRRLGSCAMNMCYVADGRLDAYWANCIKPWDCAAGTVIVRESGATITQYDGKPFDDWDPKFCVAGTANLQSQMTSILGRHPSD